MMMSTFNQGKAITKTTAHSRQQPRILAVFAHPDDESFCAGGTLAKYAADGAEIMVVSATRGDAGQIRDVRAATRRTLGQVREHEFLLACQHLGIQHAFCLDYGDGTLKDVAPEELTEQVTRIVRQFRPDVVITFGPDGAYGHPDHIAIGAATTTACTQASDATCYPDQLAVGLEPHTPEAIFHSYFPRNRMLLLDHLTKWLVEQRRFCGSLDFMHALQVLAEEASVLGYTSDHVDVQWYPTGFSIVEQGEPATRLYMMLSGAADVIFEDDNGIRHTVARLEPGMFFGQDGLAHKQASAAHIVAQDNVTCLVFAPGEPTTFVGRGANANQDLDTTAVVTEIPQSSEATTAIDVSAYVEHKVAAISAHRTQYPIAPGMLPLSMLQAIMGREYFVRVAPARVVETELFARRTFAPIITLPERRPMLAVA